MLSVFVSQLVERWTVAEGFEFPVDRLYLHVDNVDLQYRQNIKTVLKICTNQKWLSYNKALILDCSERV